jgi:hypothetical protein
MQAGLARIDDGPFEFALDSLSPVTIIGIESSDDLSVTFDNTDEWANEDDAALLIYTSRAKAPSINFFKGPYRFAGIVAGSGTTPPTSPDNSIASPFELTDGNKLFARVLSVRADGRISAAQRSGPNTIA